MILKLLELKGYVGSMPITGQCIKTFTGNQKRCTADAKKWLQHMPTDKKSMWKWEN